MSRVKGDEAEQKAVDFLQEQGFSIVERNVHSRFGEIDIIATCNGVLHFIEVKSGEDFESAVQNITPSKLSKIVRTAQIYMKKQGYDGDFVFDGVIVVENEVELIENITF